VNVSVSDGKYISFQSVGVSVKTVSEKMLTNSVIIKFSEVTPEKFVSGYKKTFISIIKSLFNVSLGDVQVLGLQPTFSSKRFLRSLSLLNQDEDEEKHMRQPDLELLLAVKTVDDSYITKKEIQHTLSSKLHSLAAQLGLKVVEVRDSKCSPNTCVNGHCVDQISMSESEVITVATDVSSLVFPQFQYGKICKCKNGYNGPTCEHIANECYRDPCPDKKLCVPDNSTSAGFTCQCPHGFAGPSCNINVTMCQYTKCDIVNPIQFTGRSYARYILKRSVERHMSISIGFKTLYSVATLMYARGLVDFSILEIVDGRMQFRFNFGSGEGLVRLNEKVVNDGEWHIVKLERHGNSAEISVDGKWRVHGTAPGLNDVLNLENNVLLFGAVVEGLHKDEQSVDRGFVGCMDDIRLDHEELPLHLNDDNPLAKLERFHNVEFKCEELKPPGVCGSHPCQNGGTCLELDTPSGFACTCAARFSGAACEFDLDPCASNPCLHGSKCVNLKNDFHCECPPKLSGKRCHYGKYCNPNPCQNSGVCEEGITGPICKCRGFTGEYCTIDVNECLHQNPCHNGGTCVNSPGGFHCICPGNNILIISYDLDY
jgi:protocadherin Fat 1/2/3